MSVSPYESALRAKQKEEKDNVQSKEPNREECREVQLLRDLRVRSLHLRLPEERVPLPGKQLPVRLPKICRRTLISHGLVHRKCERGRFRISGTQYS
jgi:hypothetical protein